MAKFGKTSRARLETCDGRLQLLFERVVEKYDCTIVYGHRGKKEQNDAFKLGKSKLKYPSSKHNSVPSQAIDVSPWVELENVPGKYGIPWGDLERFRHFSGYVLGMAHAMGLNIRWGGDWDQDMDYKNNSFNDLVHFELVE